jgi:RNA polymerase sigma factor (sigma-70 family)
MKTKVVISEQPGDILNPQLIEGCKAGDQKAQFMIYKLYFRVMYNICLSIVNNRMEAEEIMHESFLSAFEKIDTFTGGDSFGTWLQGIVVNQSLNSLRGK